MMSGTKSVIERGPMQHLPGGDTNFHKWSVPEIAYPQVATVKHDDVHRLFPSEAEAVSLEEADSDADRHQSEADQALEKDDLVIPYPHEKHHYFAMELPNTFNADA